MLVGIPAGIFAAVKRGTWIDQSLMGTALVGYSMPIFWWGLLLIILFSTTLGWTPVSGRIGLQFFLKPITGFMTIDSLLYGNWPAFVSALRHLILPSIVLGTIPLAVIARQTRSAMLEVMGEDYVRTARAKGLTGRRVIGLHALRNALIPVVTTIGLQVGVLMGGAILTETIFSWPGIGRWMVDSIYKRDYAVVQNGLLLIALIVMAVNLIVDLLYALRSIRASGCRTDGRSIRACRDRTGTPAIEPPPRASGLARVLVLFLRRAAAPSSASSIFAILVLIAIFAPLIAPYSPDTQFRDALLRPPVVGPRGRSRDSSSAPTLSAATCSRA